MIALTQLTVDLLVVAGIFAAIALACWAGSPPKVKHIEIPKGQRRL